MRVESSRRQGEGPRRRRPPKVASVATLALLIALPLPALAPGCATGAGPSEPTSAPDLGEGVDLDQARGRGDLDQPRGGVADPGPGAPVPRWDDGSRRSATDAAATVMAAFARPDLAYDPWWAGIGPLLSDRARLDYAYVLPANVPASRVTGAGSVVDEASAYVTQVEVPTDVGAYSVVLSRRDGESPWLAERITPPGDSSE